MALGGLIVLLMLAEVYLRFMLGLGNPPLWMADPEIEYLPQPSRSYVRFGHRIHFNAYAMRSRDFPQRKSDPTEVRVLVVGDSVVHGGPRADQEELATTILERQLAEALGRPVVVGNISADSWGPPNFHAYLRRFGLFEADVVVVVVNSSDYADAPTFAPLGAERPRRKPLLAIQELYVRYVLRYIRERREPPEDHQEASAEDVKACLNALREIVRLVRAGGASLVLAQHLKKSELEDQPEVGYHEIARVADEMGIEPVQLGPRFAESFNEDLDPYLDGNHPSKQGHRIIAGALFEVILNHVLSRTATAGGP
jgi:lysophospholipase L1-like esterase